MEMHPDTRAVTAGRPAREPGAVLNTPIVPASTYQDGGELVYGRDGNPGWLALEAAIGELEAGAAVAFASGLAAVNAILDEQPRGAVVLAQPTPYYGVRDQLDERSRQGRLTVHYPDVLTADAVRDAGPDLALVWIETPSNPMMDLVDISAVAEAAHDAGATVVVDATFATPFGQRSIELGADLVVHSATKLIGGHSDLLLGLAVAADPADAARLRTRRGRSGSVPGALEAFLALRGLRSLPVRLERAQTTAGELARRLEAHPSITKVRYPGLDSHPQRDLARRQMLGPGAMISFEVAGGGAPAERVCETCRLIVHATSLGGAESTQERRAKYPAERAAGTPEGLIRLSVGLEHVDDLWADLEQALDGVAG